MKARFLGSVLALLRKGMAEARDAVAVFNFTPWSATATAPRDPLLDLRTADALKSAPGCRPSPGWRSSSPAPQIRFVRPHLASEYAVLAVLWWRAKRQPMQAASPAWSWRAAGLALFVSALWAATDEFHQSFTATRTASAWDVLLDSFV